MLCSSNTYHEFADAHSILAHVYESLAPGGMVVIIDRQPNPGAAAPGGNAEHQISSTQVQNDLRQANFEVVKRDDHFIEHDPYGENWWLIVARRPGAAEAARNFPIFVSDFIRIK